jgi:SulP family sulfate permease
MMNVKVAGARTRLSTLLTGLFVLLLVVTLGPVVGLIPMSALVAVMVVVSAATFDWHSVAPRTLRVMPRSETAVMVVTVAGTVTTGNLAVGVFLGVLAAMVGFARRVAHLTTVERDDTRTGTRTYRVRGELFFASSNDLLHQFDYANDPNDVVIDLSGTDIWDASSVAALDSIRHKYAARGKSVLLTGLDGESLERLTKLSGRLGI